MPLAVIDDNAYEGHEDQAYEQNTSHDDPDDRCAFKLPDVVLGRCSKFGGYNELSGHFGHKSSTKR
jgi:hypothetical protein